MKHETLLRQVQTALLAALLCVIAPYSVPVGPIPITLATFAVYLIAGLLPPLYAAESVGLYLLLGAIGLPVFAGFKGGAAVLVSVTGGYLWGYLLGALAAALLIQRVKKLWMTPVALVAATVVIYVVGTAWYMLTAKVALLPALASCVVPFLPGDAIKIVAASVLTGLLRRALARFLPAA